jgi:histone chaperone ASF1
MVRLFEYNKHSAVCLILSRLMVHLFPTLALAFCNNDQRQIGNESLNSRQYADLEWKVLYVGSAHDSHQDQILDEILVGPVPVGMNKFVLQADAPAIEKLPDEDDLLGVTVVLVTCSYKEREFVRVGYYVNNEYTGEYDEEVGPPKGKNLDLRLVQRQILADKPRVTKFPINWGNDAEQTTTPLPPNTMGAKMEAAAGTPSTELDTDMELE